MTRRSAHAADAAGAAATDELRVMFRFLHDRAQQAAYGLNPGGGQAGVHLASGGCSRTARPAGVRDEGLFEIANHMNLGAALLTARPSGWSSRSSTWRGQARPRPPPTRPRAATSRPGRAARRGRLGGGLRSPSSCTSSAPSAST